MITSALYIGTGIALAAAVHQTVTASVQPVARVSVHLMFAVLCLSVAGFSLATALAQTTAPGNLIFAGKAIIAIGLLCWAALLGFVTLSVQPQRLWIPLALGAGWGGLFLLNLAITGPLLYLDFVTTNSPRSAFLDNGRMLPVGQAWLMVNTLALATWSYALWCARTLHLRGHKTAAVSWFLGLVALALVTVMDFATAAGWLPALFVSAFGWMALIVLFSIPLLSPRPAIEKTLETYADALPASASSLAQTPDMSSLPHIPGRHAGWNTPLHWPATYANNAIITTDAARDTVADKRTEHCDINIVVAQTIAQVLPLFDAAGIKIVLRQARDLPPVSIDRSVVTAILRDLLAEAFAASSASAGCMKPVIVMTRRTRKDTVEVSVTDGGNEMSLDDIQGVFESLLEGNQTGRGVRLIAAAERIAVQGGELRCSVNPAGGSIRHLRLPTR